MHKYVVPAIAAALMASSSFALAAQDTVGTIKTYDTKAMTLTLQDGTVFYLPKGFKDPGLKAGEKVSIAWEMKNNQHDAVTVKILK
jgi:hypothetical protein